MIEIISHCWGFSKALCYQLSSLYTYSGPDEAKVTVFYSREDELTVKMLRFFEPLLGEMLNPWEVPKSDLLRRSIGRHKAAVSSNADIVWFCDCDYYFGEGCLAALNSMVWHDSHKIHYPREVLANNTRELGDEYSARVTRPSVVRVNVEDFFPQKVRKAIGGLQIVTGSVAKSGYLGDHRRLQMPVTDGKWKPTTEDVRYRKTLGDSAIRLPNLFRIRQSVQGQCD